MSEQPTSIAPKPGEARGATHDSQAAPTVPPAHQVADAAPAKGRSRVGVFFVVIAALVVGLAAGVLLHERIGGWFGLNTDNQKAEGGDKKKLWTCSMHPQVIKDKPDICPICHMKLEPLDVVQSGQSTMGGGPASSGERKIAYWWDPMVGPASISEKPGKSAMGMDLVPVYEDEVSAGAAVRIDPVVVQNMGVRVAEVTRGPLRREIRAVGYLEEAQPLVRDVNLRVSGWVEKLYADTVGMHLKKGDRLFDLYSPEVQVAVEELIAARKASEAVAANADELARKTGKTLQDAARRKLVLWGLEGEQVDRLASLNDAPRTVTFTSPISGHLTQKMVVEGAAVKAGDMVLQVVDHSTLWLDSQVYPQDLPFIKLGQKVTAWVEGVADKQFEGEVVFIHPHVDPQTRTATVRMALPNPDLRLRPGMYATAHMNAQLADGVLLVPREAVIDTGTRQVVFVSAGRGHFEPRKVKVGSASDNGAVQVLEGLAPGDQVVTSGQFLLDAESRMREAIQKHLNEKLLANAAPGERAQPAMTKPSQATADAAPPEATSPVARKETADHGIGSQDFHTPATMPAAPPPAATAPAVAAGPATRPAVNVDAVAAAYLELSRALGAPQRGDKPVSAGGLATAASELAGQSDGETRKLAERVAATAAAMVDRPIADQRKLFKPLSEAVIALAQHTPPSAAVGEGLYVAHCPMAFGSGGDWIQLGQKIANPYYATEMKQCGLIKRPLAAAGKRGAGGHQHNGQ